MMMRNGGYPLRRIQKEKERLYDSWNAWETALLHHTPSLKCRSFIYLFHPLSIYCSGAYPAIHMELRSMLQPFASVGRRIPANLCTPGWP